MIRFASQKKDLLPRQFYNLKADLPSLPPPPLNPQTKETLKPEELEVIFPRGFIAQEGTLDSFVAIPGEVRAAYELYRPTPLIYAAGLKKALDTPAHILYKYEGVGPTGSHKSNTAIMQAYLAAQEGVEILTTETGAGQWGSALAHAGSFFGLKVKVFMVRVSYRQKPGRKTMMKLFGAEVEESPSPSTKIGKKFYQEDSHHPGSLGIAISEAVEVAVKHPEAKYSLGSVLDAVLMHQTVIGQEAIKQLEQVGLQPDIIIGCVGGGSNFAGLAFPFLRQHLKEGREIKFIAVEPVACPTLTKGNLRYDHGDTAGMTPLLFMFTLGMEFIPPPIHSGGLRYHGMAPLVSHLVKLGLVQPMACSQEKIFAAAKIFLQSEGILPAPESSHAIAVVIDEALRAREEKQEKVILFNLSGHGFLDISAYDQVK